MAKPAKAQETAAYGPGPKRAILQVRIGAFYATPLVKDEMASATVHDSIPGIANSATIQQKISPIGTLALHLPMRARTELELSASAARSSVRGTDGKTTWTVANTTVGNVIADFGYSYQPSITMHGGVGITKLFAPQTGMFAAGNSFKPLFEVGVDKSLTAGGRDFAIDARVQSHSFGTTTLRDNGAGDGNVLRAVLQIGTTLWKAGR